MQCAVAYLDSLVCTPSAQTDDLVSLISQKCLDFGLGVSAGAFPARLLLVMSIALGFSGVFQTAAVRTDSCKLLTITSREREDDLGYTGGSKIITALCSQCTDCYCALL